MLVLFWGVFFIQQMVVGLYCGIFFSWTNFVLWLWSFSELILSMPETEDVRPRFCMVKGECCNVSQACLHRGRCSLDLCDIGCHEGKESYSLMRTQIQEGLCVSKSVHSIWTTGVRSLLRLALMDLRSGSHILHLIKSLPRPMTIFLEAKIVKYVAGKI